MAGPFSTLSAAMRSSRRSPGGRPTRSLGSLLREEAVHAVQEVATPATLAAAILVGASVFVVLGPSTPGPVLPTAWRPFLATVLAVVAAVFAHLLLRARRVRPPSRPAAAVAAMSLVVAGTVVVANLLDLVTSAFPPPTSPAPLDATLDLDPVVAVAGVLLVVAVATSALGRRLGLPTSLLFLALGVVAGPGGLGWVEVGGPSTIRNLAVVALVVILFDGGVTTTMGDLRRAASPGAILATVGVMATAAITAGIVSLVLPDTPARIAWLVGAVVSSTDAAALANVLRGVRLPRRIRALLTVEAGGNDPVALLLTVGILASWDTPIGATTWLQFALWQLVGGLAVGVVVGLFGAWLMGRLSLPGASLYPVLALALASSAYGLAAVVGASGLLATYTCGVVVAATAVRYRRPVQRFTHGISTAVEVGLFLLLGLQVKAAGLAAVALPGILITLGLLVVARPVAVVVSMAGFRWPLRDVAVTGWLGIRGAVPIVLATYAATAGVDGGDRVVDVVFFVVAVSLVVQGLTARRVVDRAGLAPDGPAAPSVELLSGDLPGVDLFEVGLTAASPLVGRRLADGPPGRDVRVLLVTRGDVTRAADGDTVFRDGDLLVMSTTDRRDGSARLHAWLAAGDPPPPGSDDR